MIPPAIAISARGLRASLGGREVLHGIDLTVPQACWTSVVGPNGAGKSTLLKVLAQLLPHEGDVFLADQAVGHMPARLRARKLAWLGQGEELSEDMVVEDLVMLGRLPHRDWLGMPQVSDGAAVERALRATRTWDWRLRRVRHLSGGERQRVLLARALAVEADVLLMDEPLSNLDPPHQSDWLAVVQALVADGKTVISVLHEISWALQAQNMVILCEGHLYHHGPSADAATHQALESVFGQRIAIYPLAGQWVALPKQPGVLPGLAP